MRQVWVWVALGAAVMALTSCGEPAAAAAPPRDVLVLEVGGAQPSLREALIALGREVGAPQHVAPLPVEAAPPSHREPLDQPVDPGPRRDPKPEPGPTVDPQREPPPEQSSEWVIVRLGENEGLIHVARRHLGDGRRFGEIMEWNGWTERQTRRLPIGQEIRIKRSEMK